MKDSQEPEYSEWQTFKSPLVGEYAYGVKHIPEHITFKSLFSEGATYEWHHATVFDATFTWKKYYPNPIKRFVMWALFKLHIKGRPDIKVLPPIGKLEPVTDPKKREIIERMITGK